MTAEAESFLAKSDRQTKERIVKKLDSLASNPRLGKPLTANLKGFWSLRIGDYRAIYTIKDKELIVAVITIGHRKNVYD